MKRLFFALCSFVLIFTACGEIFEENINSDKVQLLAPGEALQSRNYTQNFSWQEVAGARSYQLQIAQPSFDALETIVLDTTIESAKFVFSMSPGKFQWRVRAENAGYKTAYSSRSLEIYPSSLAQQQVLLNAPYNGLLSNQSQLNLSWASLFGAKTYTLQVDTNNFSDTTKLVLNQQLPETDYTLGSLKDKNYQWRVSAQDDTVRSAWSVINKFTIDKTAPVQVTLISPAKNTMTSVPVNLTWQTSTDATAYELYVYSADSTSLVSSFPKTLTAGTFNLTTGNIGERLVWRVRAKDAAGNIGMFSEYRSFLVQ